MLLVKGALFSLFSVVSKDSTRALTKLSARFFASKPSAPSADVEKFGGRQTFGIPTTDALFKHVLNHEDNRNSFIHALVPNMKFLHSTRLDDHLNPLTEYQNLRKFFHKPDTAKVFRKLREEPDSFVVCKPSRSNLKHAINVETAIDSLNAKLAQDPRTKKCHLEFANHFDDFKAAFPKMKYNSQMDFVCPTDQGEYALVDMQVLAEDKWDLRALAYIAAFYGNQLRKGGTWCDIRKVIGLNILGGGNGGEVHWKNTPGQFERYYKFQEQYHKKTCESYLEGIDLFQFSLTNAPDNLDSFRRDKQDWIRYFKYASQMTEKDVESQIQTPAVLNAFKMANLSRLPREVKSAYDTENALYARVSEHTARRVAEGEAKGEAKGRAEGLAVAVRLLKQLKIMSDEEIAGRLNLPVDDVTNNKLD